ncbi:putative phage protein gp47/JayE [Variovorax boronicumulans]|uniref:baseplate J/gp47 family protein n=1 Tax=Variovorax boronicumulans TaxID=436515 RepID=UPI0027832F32|nr:baseplate J/gp47 family protein [Variovorax boronicumulans]MDP9990874.1 putative phage protein gp47/JayE [Variovorax boronicumulans]MDQ0002902.1 putative phage protein gp47/JayE [Variovorax boronicumulans]
MSKSPLNVAIPQIGELQQNAARLLQESLAQAGQSATPAQLSTADLELARSNTKVLAFVQAVGLHGAYRYLRDFIARQAIPIKSAGEFLDGWLSTYRLARKAANAAGGAVSGTGLDGNLLASGSLLQASDGRQYRFTADAPASGGVVAGNIVALLAGKAGNLPAGTALTLVSVQAGIDSQFVVGADGISGGTDVEKDEEAVFRLQQRLSNPPLGGAPADYARWAMELPGITRAWGVRNPAGPTSAGVIIMADGNAAPGIPTTGQRKLVFDYIRDPRRGPPDELFVILPQARIVNIKVRLSPDSADTRLQVIAALQDLFFREATPGQGMPMSHLVEVISGTRGEFNHTLMEPEVYSGGFLTVDSFDALLVLGTVEFV